MKKISVGIIGGAGYTGGELIRLLINHPNANIAYVQSKSNAGNLISSVHGDLIGETEQTFSAEHHLMLMLFFYVQDTGKGKSLLLITRFRQV
jgi:N-acetyl-gamma-glutamyl-phosphate reductase